MNASADGPFVPLGYALRGRFKLLEVIGEGGLSTVYRAVDEIGVQARERSPEVAVKVVRPHPTLRDELIELLHREARLLRDLVHPHLVRIYDSDFDGKYHFLVMELLQGRSLAVILRERQGRPLSPDVSFRIIRSVGSGLVHLHRLGIVHGDLKPGNVFMTAEGDVKILDFGAALMPDHAPQQDEKNVTGSLPDRVGLVTPAYASPEMLAGQPCGETDDVYALAVLAYLALTGHHPFLGRAADQALKDGLKPATPATLSAAQWRLLAAGLALSPSERIQTVSEFVEQLSRPTLSYRLFGR
jgi:serine/threonine protein kinase